MSTQATQSGNHAFQAEIEQLLDLVIHSLYTHKEIFLRELVSNASDALDKLRVAALQDASLLPAGEELSIRIEVDEKQRIVRVIDNGIGMTAAEVVENLGTIARSGTKRFLDQLKSSGGTELPRLIGQFGVGFYASFMVAREVVVETRKAGAPGATRWRSSGRGGFAIEPCERAERGTSIELHLADAEEGPQGTLEDFAQPWRLREIVKRYSDFVEYPIRMLAEGKSGEWETVNVQKPLWARPKSEIKPDEYEEFYKSFTGEFEAPLETVHLSAEGGAVWQALLFVPRSRPYDAMHALQQKSQLHLYVKRVHIAQNCEELIPLWLRFVRGLVDSDDLPLNISRETLQHDRNLKPIRSRITRKLLDALDKLRESRPADYAVFWREHGAVLKEGIWHDDSFREDILKVASWSTTHGDGTTTLAAYVERMPAAQKAIYVLLASGDLDARAAASSPHLEACRKKGFEVLLLTDPVDEFVLLKLTEHAGKPVQRLDRGVLDLDDADREAREQQEKAHARLIEDVQGTLKGRVESVRLSSRLVDSPAVLAESEGGLSPHLERMMRQSGQSVPERKRVLELNPSHPVVQRLAALREQGGEPFERAVELVHGLAAISDGQAPSDPQRFAKALSELLARG
ncbi:MAG: molecular chaperone HtpG [Planctomycetota bacterium]|nr:MAG: molecular chaperone HtpG [Planctomycetota bacterium]